jgi:hypothetical protein
MLSWIAVLRSFLRISRSLMLCRRAASPALISRAADARQLARVSRHLYVGDHVQGPLLPEFAKIVPEAFANCVKRAGIVNAWDDPNFVAAIHATRRRQLIMGGITTDVCLIFPTISAVADGFEVQAVLDISGSPYELSEATARKRMELAGVQFTATNTIIAELAQTWASPEGGQLIQVLFQDVLPPISPPK